MKHNYDEVFFPSVHFHYARYLTQYLLELSTLCEEDKVDLVCRHHDGYWNAVSADQFGEQTAIKIGKGSLKGMTLYAELVSEWIDSFPITAHVSDRMDHIYADHIPVLSSQKQHKEEFKHRRVVFWMHMIGILFMQKLRNILTLWKTIVPILTGQIAQTNVNVADSILIGEKMEREYIASLPNGFFNPSSGLITTKSVSKQQVKDKQFRLVIDLESIFLRLLMIGQQRQMEIEPVFACELCAVPPSLIGVSAKQQVRPCHGIQYMRPYHVLLKLSLWMFHSCFTILCGHMMEVLQI